MAGTKYENLKPEQQEAIEHRIIETAKNIENNFVLIAKMFQNDPKNNSDYARWKGNLSEWEKEKRNELSNLPPEKLDELVKEHKKFIEIRSLDKNNDKKIDAAEAIEFVARTLKEATRNLKIYGESLKDSGNNSATVEEIKKIAQKHNLTISDKDAKAGIDSYVESHKLPIPERKPATER